MWKRVLLFLVLIPVLCVQSCVPSSSSMIYGEQAKGLPPSELARYCDPFVEFRADLWEELHFLHNEPQMANYKRGEITVQDGRLKLETRTGAFSKVILESKFHLQGDFDVQVDCLFQFLKRKVMMDQVVQIKVVGTDRPVSGNLQAISWLYKGEEDKDGKLLAGTASMGKLIIASERSLEAFLGTLRFVRKGKRLVSLCQDKGSSEWKEMSESSCPDTDMAFGVVLSNFRNIRSSITAEDPLSVTFQNFRINAAQGIKESGI